MLKKIWATIYNFLISYPAKVSGAFAMLLQFVSSQILPLTVDQQGCLNAVVVAGLGFMTVAGVSEAKAVPALVGIIQAILACTLAFGVPWMTPTLESAIMAFVSAGSAFFVHTQVVAKGSVQSVGKHEAHYSRMRG